MKIDARVTIHQKPYEHPDYDLVHAALLRAGWVQKIASAGIFSHTLPGMYVRFSSAAITLEQARNEIETALKPLGFEISLQVFRVSEEIDVNLKPVERTPFSALFGTTSYQETALGKFRRLTLLQRMGQSK
jgi:hypothetical protein